MNLLKLLSIAENFTIYEENGAFCIRVKDGDVGAIIIKDNINYYVTDCYVSGGGWAQIDMYELSELKDFCELIIESEKIEIKEK